MQVLYHIGPASGAAKYWTTAKFDELASWCHSWWFPIVNLWKHFYAWAILVVMGLRIFWRLPRWAFKERERTWLQTQDSWDKTWHEHCLSRWGYLRKDSDAVQLSETLARALKRTFEPGLIWISLMDVSWRFRSCSVLQQCQCPEDRFKARIWCLPLCSSHTFTSKGFRAPQGACLWTEKRWSEVYLDEERTWSLEIHENIGSDLMETQSTSETSLNRCSIHFQKILLILQLWCQ